MQSSNSYIFPQRVWEPTLRGWASRQLMRSDSVKRKATVAKMAGVPIEQVEQNSHKTNEFIVFNKPIRKLGL